MIKIEKTEYVSKSFRLPTELVAKLEAISYSKQVPLSQLVIQYCKYALDNLEE